MIEKVCCLIFIMVAITLTETLIMKLIIRSLTLSSVFISGNVNLLFFSKSRSYNGLRFVLFSCFLNSGNTLFQQFWPDMWLLVQMLKVNDFKIMHQTSMFLSGFSPAQTNYKKPFNDKILYKWYKYIISLQNNLIKITTNLLIKL